MTQAFNQAPATQDVVEVGKTTTNETDQSYTIVKGALTNVGRLVHDIRGLAESKGFATDPGYEPSRDPLTKPVSRILPEEIYGD